MPEKNLTFRWYEAMYVQTVKSIFPKQDPSKVLEDCEKDVLVLEEPEHLCWYHEGQSLSTLKKHGHLENYFPLEIFHLVNPIPLGHGVLVASSVGMSASEEQKFYLGKRLGNGSFGQVFLAKNRRGKELAVKVEMSCRSSLLFSEAHLLKKIAAPGFPKVHHVASEGGFNMLAMDLLGPSLDALFQKCGRRFSLKTLLMLAAQMLDRLAYLHSKDGCNVVHLIDFGLSKKRRDKPRAEQKSLTGTARYASTRAHRGADQGYGDDLDVGSVRAPQDIPNYRQLRRSFTQTLAEEGFEDDGDFDWLLPQEPRSEISVCSPEPEELGPPIERCRPRSKRRSKQAKASVESMFTSTRASTKESKETSQSSRMLRILGCFSAPRASR
eukprot:g28042.t1